MRLDHQIPISEEAYQAALERAEERVQKKKRVSLVTGRFVFSGFANMLTYVLLTMVGGLILWLGALSYSSQKMSKYEGSTKLTQKTEATCLHWTAPKVVGVVRPCGLIIHRHATLGGMPLPLMMLLAFLTAGSLLWFAYGERSILLTISAAALVAGCAANAMSISRWGGVADFIKIGQVLASPGDILLAGSFLLALLATVVIFSHPVAPARRH